MKIQFLGSGNAFTDFRENYYNNVVVETEEGPFLIDCGDTTRQALKELERPVHTVAGIGVTHMHDDHVNGIAQFLLERYYTPVAGQVLPSRQQTPIYAPNLVWADLQTYLNRTLDKFVSVPADPELFPQMEMRPGGLDHLVTTSWGYGKVGGFRVGGVNFLFQPVIHGTLATFGVHISDTDDPTREVFFTSDTQFDPDIGSRFPTAQIIFHDCTFLPKFPGTIHTHYEELVTLPGDVKARIVLMHHQKVPEGIDVIADGFRGAAKRFEVFEL